MFKPLVFAFALAVGLFASPSASPVAAVDPVLVTVASVAPENRVKLAKTVKVKHQLTKKERAKLKKEKQKKKHAAHSSHPKSKSKSKSQTSSGHHSHDGPAKKIPTSFGPVHLTGPPFGL